ncbi:MAG: DUF366 family protein [Proteobacteria bacterium]|nr:MAG: DUF366 family protein [Pseudomonadota bacterium]
MSHSLLQTHFAPKQRTYFGPELRPHFILSEYRIAGDALLAFVGPCDVKTDHLVDWEDRLNDDHIRAESMVHFLGEFFGTDIREIVLFQRLLAAQVRTLIAEVTGEIWERSGDDIYWKGKKLSVSIVTQSPVSSLIHFAVNWDPTGAPVDAVGLNQFLDEKARDALIQRILTWASTEWDSIRTACVKVRPVM